MWQSLSGIARSWIRQERKARNRRAFFEGIEARNVLTTLWISSSPFEESASGGFWVGRNGDATAAMDVHVQVSSAAASVGNDIAALDETIRLNADQTQVWVEIEQHDDTFIEPVEPYAVSASTNSGLTASGQGWIVDNDAESGSGSGAASGSLWIAGGSYAENSTAGFWIGRTGAIDATLDIDVALSSNTALSGFDFAALARSVHLDAGQSQAWVEIHHLDDTSIESSERYSISASAEDGRTANGEGWIVDNDGSGSGSGSGLAPGSGSGSGTPSGSGSGGAPSILEFTCTILDDVLTITGSVVDDVDPTGYWVHFGDLLQGRSVQVLADNTFELVIDDWSQHGDISAWVTDDTLLTSQTVWDTV